MFPRLAATAVIAGGVLGGVALTHSGSGSASATANQSATTTVANADMSAARVNAGRSGGFGGRAGAYGHIGRGLTVTGVSGNTITATDRRGQTVTITVNSSTKYSEAGASASLSDIANGSTIAVQGTRSSATAITATSITIVLPTEAGVVTNVNGSTLTLSGFNGTTHTVTVDSSTRYQKAGQTATLADITTGTSIVATGKTNSDGSLSAMLVTIRVPRLSGQVTAVNGSSFTVTGFFGKGTYTVDTGSSTTYVNPDGTAASASAIKSGTNIIAEGTLSADGKTLTALRIVVLPANASGHAFPGRGGFDFPGTNGNATGTITPAASGGQSV